MESDPRSIHVTPRELALIHESLSHQVQELRTVLTRHAEQDDTRFADLNEALFNASTGLAYRVYGTERTAKSICSVVKWFAGVVSVLFVSGAIYMATQLTETVRVKDQLLYLYPQLRQELPQKK